MSQQPGPADPCSADRDGENVTATAGIGPGAGQELKEEAADADRLPAYGDHGWRCMGAGATARRRCIRDVVRTGRP